MILGINLKLIKYIIVFFSFSYCLNATVMSDSLETVQTMAKGRARVRILNELASSYPDINMLKSLEYAGAALTLAQRMNYVDGKARALKNFAFLYQYLGQYNRAARNLELAVSYFNKTGNMSGLAECMEIYGSVFKSKGDSNNALRYYQKAFSLSSRAKNFSILTSSSINMAKMNFILGNKDEALKYLIIVRDILIKNNSYDNLIILYNYLIAHSFIEGDIKSSTEYQQQLRTYSKHLKQNRLAAIASHNRGVIYLYNDKLTKAAFEFKSALKIFESIRDKKGVYCSYIKVAETFMKGGKYVEALDNLNHSLRISSDSIIHIKDLKAYKDKWNILAGAVDESVDIYALYASLKDSILSKEANTREYSSKLEDENLQKDIALLEKDSDIKELQINTQILETKKKELETEKQADLFVFVIILSLLILITVVLALRFYHKRKTAKLFEQKNKQLEIINKMLTESETSLKESCEANTKYLNIINSELEKAADYIHSLLPKPLDNSSIQTEWNYIPSAQLGGDSFGYHFLDENHIALYLIDVSGHGIGPALHSVSVLNIIRSQSLANTDYHEPAQILNKLNNSFRMDNHNSLFFTMWYGVYNIKTRKLKYAGAGHPPAIMISGKEDRPLDTKNPIIGFLNNFDYQSADTILPEETEIYIFSDGVYEIKQKDGKMQDYDQFYQYIIDNRNGISISLDQLYEKALENCGAKELEDDFSILKISFK